MEKWLINTLVVIRYLIFWAKKKNITNLIDYTKNICYSIFYNFLKTVQFYLNHPVKILPENFKSMVQIYRKNYTDFVD